MPAKTSGFILQRQSLDNETATGGAAIAIVMNSILLIFAMIITYPSALPKDRRLIRVVEAELMHSSQGEHHPWGTEADPSSLARLAVPAGDGPCRCAGLRARVCIFRGPAGGNVCVFILGKIGRSCARACIRNEALTHICLSAHIQVRAYNCTLT